MKTTTLMRIVLGVPMLAGAPPAQAADTFRGLSCGMVTSNDPTAQVDENPHRQFGPMLSGPTVVANTTGGSVTSVTITCTVQVNQAGHGGSGVARNGTIDCRVAGARVAACTGAIADTVQYDIRPTDDAYLCTAVSWTSSKGGGSYLFDADGLTPGNQCALATRVQTPSRPPLRAGADVVVVVQRPMP